MTDIRDRALKIVRERRHDELRAYVDGVRYFADDAMASKIASAAVFGGSVDPVARLQFEAWDALRRMHVVALAESYARCRAKAYPLSQISMGRPPPSMLVRPSARSPSVVPMAACPSRSTT